MDFTITYMFGSHWVLLAAQITTPYNSAGTLKLLKTVGEGSFAQIIQII